MVLERKTIRFHSTRSDLERLEIDTTWCYFLNMSTAEDSARAFKTRWFSKAAKKVKIRDAALCEAIAEVMRGQADDLGGGVFKKRLNKNMHRSIILARGGKYWVYTYLFAKNNRDNIDEDELEAFRRLADIYASKTDSDIANELAVKELMEICHEDKVQVQE